MNNSKMNGQKKCRASRSLSSGSGRHSIRDRSPVSGSSRRSIRNQSPASGSSCRSMRDRSPASGSGRRSIRDRSKQAVKSCTSQADPLTIISQSSNKSSFARPFRHVNTQAGGKSPSTDVKNDEKTDHDGRFQSDSVDKKGGQNLSKCNNDIEKEDGVGTNSMDVNANGAMDNSNKVSEAAEYICGICEETFNDEDQLIQHMGSHPEFVPPVVMEGNDSDEVDVETVKKRPQGKKCKLCTKYFIKLARHMRKMHTPLRCTCCDKIFKDRLKMKTHVLRVHSGKKYKCELCEKSYTTRYQLRIHKETKHGDNASMCEVCGEVFFHEVNLKRHKKMHLGEEYKDFVCEVCGKRFAFHNKWRHIRTHTKTKAFKCPDCDKTFNEKDQLNKHVRIHTGEKPYKCEHCPKAFNHNVSLKAHVRKCH